MSYRNLTGEINMNEIKYNYDMNQNEYDFSEDLDGTIVNVGELPMLVTCKKCGLEIEEEAIIRGGRSYHYSCSGMEL